jgi:hypothetical protein
MTMATLGNLSRVAMKRFSKLSGSFWSCLFTLACCQQTLYT